MAAYSSIGAVPKEISIDIVDIFRRPEAVPEIVDEAIERGVKVVWMQLGVIHEEAAQRARGVRVVMDRCMKEEFQAHLA